MSKEKAINKLPMNDSVVMTLPQPPERKAGEYLTAYKGYVYTATSAIAQDVASIDLKLFKTLYKRDEDVITDEVKIHPALSLLDYVNDFTTFYDLLEATSVYLDLVGEAFWLVLRDDGTGEPREIWSLRPDWIKIIPDEEEVISHYVYSPGGIDINNLEIPKENIIPFKYFNPKNMYRGKGTVQAGAMSIDIYDFAQEYNRSFFFNSAIPGLVFTSDKKFNKKAIERFVNQWTSSYGGRQKSHKVAFLGGGFKIDKISSGGRELDFVEQSKMMRDNILAVFRVPKTVLGLTEDVNRANAEATTRAYMERVVTPRMQKIVGTLTEFLLPMYDKTVGYFFDFVDPSPEDVEQKLKKYENGRKFGWLTPNEIRLEENLEPIEGGDILAPVVNASVTPDEEIDGGSDEEAPDETGDTNEEEEKNWFNKFFTKKSKKSKKSYKMRYKKPFKHMMSIPAKKLDVLAKERLQTSLTKDFTKLLNGLLESKSITALKEKRVGGKRKHLNHSDIWTEKAKDVYWTNFITKASHQEVDFRNRIKALLHEQELDVLNRLMTKLRYERKSKRKDLIDDISFNVSEWTGRWLALLLPFLKDIIFKKGDETMAFLDQRHPFNMSDTAVLTFLQDRAGEFITTINETTQKQLGKTLAEGIVGSESLEQLRKRVLGVFKNASGARARAIARTEVMRANNFATHAAYIQSGVVIATEWLSERDDRVCPFCLLVDGKVVDIKDVFFKEGDTLTAKNDKGKNITMGIKIADVGYPPLHTNCRCTTIPVVTSMKNVSLVEQLKLKEEVKEEKQGLLKDARARSQKMIDEAMEKAHVMLEEAKAKDSEKGQTGTKILRTAENDATKLVKDARTEAKGIVKQAKEDAEAEKKTILGQLKKLRSKALRTIFNERKQK